MSTGAVGEDAHGLLILPFDAEGICGVTAAKDVRFFLKKVRDGFL